MWSKPIPLAWYFAPQWEQKYGLNWPQMFCDNWIINDRRQEYFANKLPLCPCTLKHALNDKGRYMPDIKCDKSTNSTSTCLLNAEAFQCMKSPLLR